jgi:pyruvate/2-oxoglutarate/acetoin dehydrogenase E1 component
MSALTTVQFLRNALDQALAADSRVFIMGEDIAAYGGSFGVTRGLIDKYGPERIRNTPISEPAFTGMAIGAAVAGSRPIVEIMFMDFVTLCVDQLVNMAAKLHYVYGQSCPLVLRTAMGAGRSYGATHSQCLERLFTGIPGLKVVAGSDGPDCARLLLGALADPNPVVVLEHKLLYPIRFEEPEGPLVPVAPGSARVTRQGTDVTIVAWSYMAHLALQAANTLAEEEIEAEVVDVRSLAPLDAATLVASAQKTGRVLVVEEGPITGGVAAEIATRISEGAFGSLAAPVRRLAMPDVPVPSARELERAVMPSAASIADAAKDLAMVV